MSQDELMIILIICGGLILCIFSFTSYIISRQQKKINILTGQVRQMQFKFQLWDSLLYDDDPISPPILDEPKKHTRRDNVVYLTPPDEE